MSKLDIVNGHATLEDLAYWINERHRIYVRRFEQVQPKPWTSDPILQEYKFTNVFRELDTGTKFLRMMCQAHQDPTLLVFNIIWYRLFNRFEHALDIGFMDDIDVFLKKMKHKAAMGEKIFTSAHMTAGKAGVSKLDYYLDACSQAWDEAENLAVACKHLNSIESAFNDLRGFQCIGPFVAYEIASDFRWYPQILPKPYDVLNWANIGPGCMRGLRRLGLDHKEDAIGYVYDQIHQHLQPHVLLHVPEGKHVWPPFELREVEHSLCEFDKYQRVKTGVGRPRQRFNGS